MAKRFLIKNNGYWYKAWYEPSPNGRRKLKKIPLRDNFGKTLKVIRRGHKDNDFEARLLLNNNDSSVKIDIPLTIEETLPMFEKYLIDKGKKPLTIKTYLHDIKVLSQSLPDNLSEHSLALVNSVIEGLNVSPITKQKYAKSLSRYYDVMKRNDFEGDPMKGFEWKSFDSTPNPFKETEIFHLLDTAKEMEKKLKIPYYTFTLFAFQTGLRLNEYIHLKWDNLNWKDGIYNIFKEKDFTPKHNRQRQVKIPKQSLTLLKALPHKGEYIFCRGDGRKWDNHFPRDFVNNVFKLAGIGGDLDRIRETFVSWSFACGRTHKSLKEHLGHKRYEELEAYDGIANNPSKRIKEIFGTIDVNTK